MSGFSNPHFMDLFDLKNGRKKLAYGQSPEDALDILRMRLTEREMEGNPRRPTPCSSRVRRYLLRALGLQSADNTEAHPAWTN